jgi:hypothetical protein
MAFNPLAGFNNPWAAGGGSAALNTPAISNKPSMEALQTNIFDNDREVLGLSGEGKENGKKGIELRAEFIYCFTQRVINEEGLNEDSMRLISHNMGKAIDAFFSGGIETAPNTFLREKQFKHYFSKDVPPFNNENLQFNNYEEFINLSSKFSKLDSDLKNENFQFKNIKNRGVKVIVIEHAGLQNSRAEKNGMRAFLNFEHIRKFMFVNNQPKAYELQNITLCHEVGHLFGLSDRYQFLTWYNQIDSNCFSIVANGGRTRDLIPIPIDTSIDERANDDTMAYSNLMYGANDFSNLLTEYQLKIIWGIAGETRNIDVEDDYIQTIFIIPNNINVYTGVRFRIERRENQMGFLGSITNGNVYSQLSGPDGLQDFNGQGFLTVNGVIGNNVNNVIAAIPKIKGGNTVNIQDSNLLGSTIWTLPDCQPPSGSNISATNNQLALNFVGN